MLFSHIYIEKSIASHPVTQGILEKFPKANIIEIDNYKQFFNRPNQNFMAQRSDLKLILAKQEEHFLHQGSDRVRSFGEAHIVSCSMIRNCIYHCEYCFLSGMHESANIVLYVNIEDFETEVRKVAKELAPDPVYLVSSYLSDLPAFEHFIPICEMWMNIVKDIPNLDLEIRTKSDGYRFLQNIGAQHNTVLTWSLSPSDIVRKYEHGTASLQTRILQASQAIRDNWRVRLCFDPILHYDNWQEDYTACVAQTFARCSPDKIEKVSYGMFRMGTTYLQNMRRVRPGASVLHRDIVTENKLSSYPKHIEQEIQDTFYTILSRYLPDDKIHFVHG